MTQEWTFLENGIISFEYNGIERVIRDCLTFMIIHSGYKSYWGYEIEKNLDSEWSKYLEWLRIDSAINGYDRMKAIIS